MAEADRGVGGWSINQTTDLGFLREEGVDYIKAGRLQVYKILLKRLGSDVTLELRTGDIYFVYDFAGTLTIGPELEKGIVYPSDITLSLGKLADSLDQPQALPTANQLYVKPLERGWYIYYEDL